MNQKQKINDSDIDCLVSYLLTVPFDTNITPEEFGYSNPVLICMDAVLSINRKYYSFVVPRINHELIIFLKRIHGFKRCWNSKI